MVGCHLPRKILKSSWVDQLTRDVTYRDRRPTSSSENFHAHSSLPEVSIESIVFQEIRHEMEAAAVAPSVDSMLGYCIGSLAWNRPQEDMNTRAARTGKSIYIQSFRTQPLMSPHAHTVMIPVFVTSNPTSVEQEQVRKEKQSQMWKAYQLDLERNVAASNQVIVFYPVRDHRCWCLTPSFSNILTLAPDVDQ